MSLTAYGMRKEYEERFWREVMVPRLREMEERMCPLPVDADCRECSSLVRAISWRVPVCFNDLTLPPTMECKEEYSCANGTPPKDWKPCEKWRKA